MSSANVAQLQLQFRQLDENRRRGPITPANTSLVRIPDGRPICDTQPDAQDFETRPRTCLCGDLRTRSRGHITNQYIDELRKLVNLIAPDEAPRTRDPRIPTRG